MDSCDITAASQTLQNDTRAPQNLQTMADTNELVAVDVDAGEKTRIKETVCGEQAGGTEVCSSTSPARKVNGQDSLNPNAAVAATGRSEGGPAVLRDWVGIWTHAIFTPRTAKLSKAATRFWTEETRPWRGDATAMPRQAKTNCDLGSAHEASSRHFERILRMVEPTNMGLGTPDAAALIVCWQLECPMLPSASWTLMLPPVPSSSSTNICMFGGTSTELMIVKRHLHTYSHDEHDWHLYETNPTALALCRIPCCDPHMVEQKALLCSVTSCSVGKSFSELSWYRDLVLVTPNVLQWKSRCVVVELWLLQT